MSTAARPALHEKKNHPLGLGREVRGLRGERTGRRRCDCSGLRIAAIRPDRPGLRTRRRLSAGNRGGTERRDVQGSKSVGSCALSRRFASVGRTRSGSTTTAANTSSTVAHSAGDRSTGLDLRLASFRPGLLHAAWCARRATQPALAVRLRVRVQRQLESQLDLALRRRPGVFWEAARRRLRPNGSPKGCSAVLALAEPPSTTALRSW